MWLRTLAEVVDHLGSYGTAGIIDGTEIRVRWPAAGRKDRDKLISGKNKQNTVEVMLVTEGKGRVLWCSPARPASCADITHARQLGLVKVPGRRARGRDSRQCRLPGTERPDRRPSGDT
ncbi:transposase family protein [Streptomyces sp. NPDC055709]